MKLLAWDFHSSTFIKLVCEKPDVEGATVSPVIVIRKSDIVTYTSGQLVRRTPSYPSDEFKLEGYKATILVRSGGTWEFEFDNEARFLFFVDALDDTLRS
jgi:hypothetical protein